MNVDFERQFKALALSLAVHCVRNTYLEDLHAGTSPSSKTGDFSDVKVVTPYGEIPWNEVSRFNDEEMKILMKEVVDKIYSVLIRMDDDNFIQGFLSFNSLMVTQWDEPKNLKELDKFADKDLMNILKNSSVIEGFKKS